MSTNYAMARPSQNLHLTQEVYAILDSRIQYLEYQISLKMYPITSSQEENKLPSSAKDVLNNYDELLVFVAEQTQHIQLLQVLRSWLMDENAAKVLNLIQDNRYQNYAVDSLEALVKKRTSFHRFSEAR